MRTATTALTRLAPARGRLIGAATGVLADMALGEPPVSPHPVAAFAGVMQAVEGRLWSDSRARGVLHAGAGALLGAGTGRLGRVVLGRAGGAAVSAYLAVAQRQLGRTAVDIGALLEGGRIDEAREALPSLVGRDPTGLDARELARAVVESVAENTVDAVVAPALWAAAGGGAGALGYRAVNTLDSMVGHRDPRYRRYGWASARLDDLVNLVPARATAVLVASVRPGRAAEVARVVRRDGRSHPSPNAGVAEAAFAAALGIRLGGVNTYGGRTEVRGPLGDGRAPEAADIRRAVRLSRDVSLALVAGLAVAGLAV